MDEILCWCLKCERFVTHEPASDHEPHRAALVGIRADIFRDEMRRIVRDLRLTDRLEKWSA